MSPDDKPLATARAPGKLILLGEHAVVYGRPAIAVPASAVEARVQVRPAAAGLVIEATFPPGAGRLDLAVDVARAPATNPLARAVREALRRAGHEGLPDWRLELSSTVPVGSGMGSSAAVAVALARAVGEALGRPFDAATASAIALEAERRTHGTPSGIDNTVIAMDRPIRFQAGRAADLPVGAALHLLVADSGAAGPTRSVVGAVRRRMERRPEVHDAWFDHIAELVDAAAAALARGEHERLGQLMDENHLLLQALGVSTPLLDDLVDAARSAGALGAKLSGAGGGGVVAALVAPERLEPVTEALGRAGAVQVWHCTVPERNGER